MESSEDASSQNLKVRNPRERENLRDPNENFKVIAHFMPRRRFSQGAVSALKDILENLEAGEGEGKEEEKGMIDPEEFASLSREEQLKVVLENLEQT